MILIYLLGVVVSYITLRNWQKEEYDGLVGRDWFDVMGTLTSSLGSWLSLLLIIYMRLDDDHLSNNKPPDWL